MLCRQPPAAMSATTERIAVLSNAVDEEDTYQQGAPVSSTCTVPDFHDFTGLSTMQIDAGALDDAVTESEEECPLLPPQAAAPILY